MSWALLLFCRASESYTEKVDVTAPVFEATTPWLVRVLSAHTSHLFAFEAAFYVRAFR
jgi:hypothetical protein